MFSQNSKTPAHTQNPSQENEKSEAHSATPKKRLMLSLSEKEKLLNWNIVVTPEETVNNAHQHKDEVESFIKAVISLVVEKKKATHAFYLSILLPSLVLCSDNKDSEAL